MITTEDWSKTIEQHPTTLNEIFLNWLALRTVHVKTNERKRTSSEIVINSDSDSDDDILDFEKMKRRKLMEKHSEKEKESEQG